MSPPPWTLFWPRSGLTPLPYRPTCPVSRTRLIRARTLSTALWCSVMPSVQQIIARVGRRERVGQLADRVGRDAGLALGVLERVRLDLRPVRLEVLGRAVDERLVLEARAMISRPIAFARAMSLPTSRPSQTSAHSAPSSSGAGRPRRAARRCGRRAGGGGRRSGASRGRCCPTGRSGPSLRPHGMNLCRHRHRTRSPDRRRWGRVRSGCSCRCCCCPARPWRTSGPRS